ncbi:MAG TPA: FKBP-type peptidyl-prolyl cis-trans isomerase [Fimbriimonadaceae bacterium]|nr:FKBP-type peptidyl-prolyl cis-trans isomerase [Fimbriimonadaceae bacterium]
MRTVSFVTAMLATFWLVGCAQQPAADTKSGTTGSDKPDANVKVQIEEIKPGTGDGAKNGDILLVIYSGTLKSDGSKFDSNDSPDDQPFPVILGAGGVIKGWEDGLQGMKVGGERKLTIPYQLAYGEEGQPPKIPGKADLVFNVKLLDRVPGNETNVFDKKDVKVGTGPKVKSGDSLDVHYVGKLVNGKEFDNSRKRGKPLTFTIGQGGVIPGWDVGILGMQVGGVRTLRIPPAIAYGPQGSPPNIGPNQVLVFEVELMKITPKAPGAGRLPQGARTN